MFFRKSVSPVEIATQKLEEGLQRKKEAELRHNVCLRPLGVVYHLKQIPIADEERWKCPGLKRAYLEADKEVIDLYDELDGVRADAMRSRK